MWDAFISYASEDKEKVALPLANALTNKGLSVWYDDFILKIGDSLSKSINKGLAESNYGIVILSKNFFAKEFPQWELSGLVSRELSGENKVILPIWHEIEKEEVRKASPTLADRKAANTKAGLDYVVEEILKVIKPTTSDLIGLISGVVPLSEIKENDIVTQSNLGKYVKAKWPEYNFGKEQLRYTYNKLREQNLNFVGQVDEAINDPNAQQELTEIYQRLLGRDSDPTGVLLYQPLIFVVGSTGTALVEQSILASPEYKTKQLMISGSFIP